MHLPRSQKQRKVLFVLELHCRSCRTAQAMDEHICRHDETHLQEGNNQFIEKILVKGARMDEQMCAQDPEE